jgi:hypothetical protein
LKPPDFSEFPRVKRDSIRGSSLVVGRELVWHRKSNGGSNKCGGIQMEPRITAAARALEAGDPLGGVNPWRFATMLLRSRFEVSPWSSTALSATRSDVVPTASARRYPLCRRKRKQDSEH